MRMSTVVRRLLPVAIAGLVEVGGPTAALSSPPANDAFADATPISGLPYADTGELDGTTTESGEPQTCTFKEQSAWYSVTFPSAAVLKANLDGSDFGVTFSVYQSYGVGIGGLGWMGCAAFGGSMEFTAEANATYYIQVGSASSGPAHLQLNVESVPPPANDDFANAIDVGSRPFLGFADLTPATIEPGEPITPPGAFTPIVASAWYVFTPTFTETLSALGDSCCATPILAVYTGDSLQNLTPVAGGSGSGRPVTFQAVEGTRYYFQLGRGSLFGGTAPMSFRLDLTLPPVAGFWFYPNDPSIFDTVQFGDTSYDPGQTGWASQEWRLGDGTSASGAIVSHRYAADGDYTVNLEVTTLDGRSASLDQVVRVRTHDVAITKFTVPTSARSGQTRELTVGIRNSLYPESVQVQLFTSVPGFGGFQLVGTLTQLIPVRPGNKTVPVSLSYTFTPDDAAVGKVTFQAIATIMGARDAISADNTAVAAPTRVTR